MLKSKFEKNIDFLKNRELLKKFNFFLFFNQSKIIIIYTI